MVYSKETHKVSIRKACCYFELSYSVLYYKKRRNSQDDLIREELKALAENETWGGADAPPLEEHGLLVESQTDLQDLSLNEIKLEKQT